MDIISSIFLAFGQILPMPKVPELISKQKVRIKESNKMENQGTNVNNQRVSHWHHPSLSRGRSQIQSSQLSNEGFNLDN